MTATHIPLIETERLVLQGHRLEDFEDCFAMWADPAVVRFISGKPSTREEMWSRLLRYVGHWTLLGYGFWVVREKGTGRLVGEVGLGDFHRNMQPPLSSAVEAGWVLASGTHGKGYATEAVRAALAWADAHLRPERVACIIAPENTASLRVASKCGFRPTGQGVYMGQPTLMFERVAATAPGTR
ncbi:acetyltransferase, GNAT family [Myxococcus hansupus]|uniref:Acetyltransferase, GNAT family n=1 Tax=Pseudomyxococcus hansupus TaxID=1297742 RepID=A0A0H4X9X9_9BACT|nr:GNAT family N-acetyltransferase [Myxococcus hansupus]AKQ64692.1 acetyltransferase, GNAT family [Myxococcus hansupus]